MRYIQLRYKNSVQINSSYIRYKYVLLVFYLRDTEDAFVLQRRVLDICDLSTKTNSRRQNTKHKTNLRFYHLFEAVESLKRRGVTNRNKIRNINIT